MMPHSSLEQWLCRTYAVLLYAYPREFRIRYGGEMEQLFRDRCRAVAMTQSLRGPLRFGAHGGADWLITTTGEWIVTMRSATPSTVRIALLLGITLSLTMMGISVFLYRPLLAMPGGPTYVLETTVALVAYGSLIVWATRSNGSLRGTVLLLGTPVGLIAAAVQIVHLVTENFVHFGAPWEGITTLTFMLGTFLLWGVAGYRCARSIGAAGPAAVAGSWSAVVTMSILVTFGFALELYVAVPKPEYVGTWREFKRSGWTDVHAFTIANALDAALSHLIIGPVVGAIFGVAAGVIAHLRGKGQSNPALGLQ